MRHPPTPALYLLNLLLGLAIVGVTPGCDPLADKDDIADDDIADDDSTDDDDNTDDDDSTDDELIGKEVTEFVTALAAGWYFGECGGNCSANVTIDAAGDVVYRVFSGELDVTWQLDTQMTASGNADLALLEDAADFFNLDPVYGCPDCADGGGQYISWEFGFLAGRSDYDFSEPPAVLQALDDALRAIIAEAESCSFGDWLEPPTNPCTPVSTPLNPV